MSEFDSMSPAERAAFLDLQAGKVTNDLNELRACPDRRAGR